MAPSPGRMSFWPPSERIACVRPRERHRQRHSPHRHRSAGLGRRRRAARRRGAGRRGLPRGRLLRHHRPRRAGRADGRHLRRERALLRAADRGQARLAIDQLGSNRGYVGLGVEALDEKTAPTTRRPSTSIWTDGRRGRPTSGRRCRASRDVVQALFRRRARRRPRAARGLRARPRPAPRTSSPTRSTGRSPPCACCTIRRRRSRRRAGRSAPARTPTTATSRCSRPTASPACRCAAATAPGSTRRRCRAPSSATSATA